MTGGTCRILLFTTFHDRAIRHMSAQITHLLQENAL